MLSLSLGRGLIGALMVLTAVCAADRGRACTPEQTAAGRGVTVDVPSEEVGADAEIALTWSRTGPKPRAPVFLVVSVPERTRFSGTGFLALAPGARAPSALAANKDRLRAVVPLHWASAEETGTITLKPYQVGAYPVTWSVVAVGACGERVIKAGRTARVAVTAGDPEVVIQEPYSLLPPKRRIRSRRGDHDLLVYDGRFEVIDVRTGDKIVDEPGVDPNFSPTGRFVAARDRNNQGYDIFDLLAGGRRTGAGMDVLVWARNDSFAVTGALNHGRGSVFSPLVDGSGVDLAESCDGCSIWWTEQVVLEPELGFVAVANEGGGGTVYDVLTWSSDDGSGDVLSSIREAHAPRYPGMPKTWRLGEPLAVSNWIGNLLGAADDDPGKSDLTPRHFLVTHRELPPAPAGAVAAGDAPEARSLKGRPLETVVRGAPDEAPGGVDASGLMALRMAEAGIPTLPAGAPAEVIDAGNAALGVATDDEARSDASSPALARARAARLALMRRLLAEAPALAPHLKAGGDWDFCDGHVEGVHHVLTDADQVRVLRLPVPAAAAEKPDADREAAGVGRDLVALQTLCVEGRGSYAHQNVYLAEAGAGGRLFDVSPPAVDAEEVRAHNRRQVPLIAARPRRDLVLLGSAATGEARLFDTAKGEKIGEDVELKDGDALRELRVTGDGRHLVQVNHGGTFNVYDLVTRERVLLGRYVGDEVVTYLEDGTYDAGYEGAHAVRLRFPGQPGFHPFAQFASRLRRPGLARAVLSGASPDTADRTVLPPPRVELDVERQAGRPLVARVVAERGTAEEDGRLSAVRLLVDGLVAAERRVAGTRRAETVLTLDDPGGGHWIAAVAVDAAGILSRPSAVRLPGDVVPRGTLRAVLVGVDRFADPRITPLGFARSDAERMAIVLRARGGRSYARVEARVLADEAASAPAILETVRAAVEATGPGDTLVLFAATHALDTGPAGTADAPRYVLATPETRLEPGLPGGLEWAEVTRLVSRARGRVVVLLDACHAGAAGHQSFATNDAAVEQLMTRSGAPVIVLAASKGRQESIEAPEAGGGLFTTALVEALGEPDRTPGSTGSTAVATGSNRPAARSTLGPMDLSELYERVKRRVAVGSKGAQIPWLSRNALIGDLSLF